MEAYLAPAIIVAISGLILQGINAAFDLYDSAKARKLVKRQSNIALFVALLELIEAAGLSPGEVLVTKEALVKLLLSDTLSPETLEALNLQDRDGLGST